VSAPDERRVRLPAGGDARILEKGSGETVVFLGGLLGLPRWIPFLELLAERRRVVAPSLPGFFGSESFRDLDGIADYVSATLDLLDAAEVGAADLVGASIGGALAAEVAAFSRESVRRLVLVAPFGLFDVRDPTGDPYAQRRSTFVPLVTTEPERLEALLARPDGRDEVDWEIEKTRAEEAGARLLWPTGDTGLAKRLHRIHAPTLLVWGAEDRLVPPSYMKKFASRLTSLVEMESIAGAGHMVELDRPDDLARAALEFIG
jgi:pimeloyl-ACP methyl ester carboxylesterase